MSEPFLAEIRIFAGNFAPRGWAFCDGQLLPIDQNTALFSLLGTVYGGDGQTTFALPDLQGRAPMHPGRGPGLIPRGIGDSGGVESVALSEAQLPNHAHAIEAAGQGDAHDRRPNQRRLGASPELSPYASGAAADGSSAVITERGESEAHNNLQPHLVMNFIIALVGLYPSRS